MPAPELFLLRPDVVAGRPYNTQFHFVVPSPGSVVIISANSFVPTGGFDQDSAGLIPTPSHVYSTGSVPASMPASLESKNESKKVDKVFVVVVLEVVVAVGTVTIAVPLFSALSLPQAQSSSNITQIKNLARISMLLSVGNSPSAPASRRSWGKGVEGGAVIPLTDSMAADQYPYYLNIESVLPIYPAAVVSEITAE